MLQTGHFHCISFFQKQSSMKDKQVCCTVVKPWNLLLRMRQHCIGWSIVWYIFNIYVYIIYYHIQNTFRTWSQSHMRFETNMDLCSHTCSTQLASLTQERSISQCLHKKSHQKTQSCAWMLANEQAWPHLRCLYMSYLFPLLHNTISISISWLLLLLHSPFLWG